MLRNKPDIQKKTEILSTKEKVLKKFGTIYQKGLLQIALLLIFQLY